MNKVVKKNNKSKVVVKRKVRKIGKRLPNNRKRRTNIIRGRKIAAASAANFKKKFTMLRQNGNSVRVTGRDLIYSIPDDLTSPIQNTSVITVIPANPAYWKGTRIAALASGYQNYRPILFKITYIPMCAVTQQGNVIGGTIWDDGIDNDNLQQSLRTSNGGFMTQCYVPHTTKIRPKSNLQFNLYRMGGEFSTTSNPFIFVALAIGCKNSNNQRIIPGYFYVTWSFELKNPIGSINTYNNSGLIQYQNLVPEMNNTLINIDTNSDVPFGAYVNVEQEDEDLKAYYNDTPIEISAGTPVWAFTSVTRTSNSRLRQKIPIIYDGVTTSDITFSLNKTLGYIIANDQFYDIYVANSLAADYEYVYHQEDTALLLGNMFQNFGERAQNVVRQVDAHPEEKVTKQVDVQKGQLRYSTSLVFYHYKANKNEYVATLINRFKKRIKEVVQKDNEEEEQKTEEDEQEKLISNFEEVKI